MPNSSFPAIPSGPNDPGNFRELRKVLDALKECVELLTYQRRKVSVSAATIQDLIDLGLIVEADLTKLKR